MIVDQIGILAELYTWGQAAFVGGSFRKQVHSVMEPLACGIPVAVGPFHQNNREALEFQQVLLTCDQRKMPVVQCVQTPADFETFWQQAVALTKADQEQLQKQVEAHQGATQKILQKMSVSL